MFDSVAELKSSWSIEGEDFQNFEMLDARMGSALNKIIQNSHFKKKVTLEKQFLRGRQIAYMIYDYFRVTGAHETVFDCAVFFSFSPRNDDVQDFDTRWDEILLSMIQFPSDDILENLHKLRKIRESKLNTVLELYNMEISLEESRTWLSQIEDDGEKKHRSQTEITKFWCQTHENWDRSSGQESYGNEWHGKRKKEFAIRRKQKGSVREETNAVSGMTVMNAQNRHQKPLHPLSHQHQEVEVRREKGASEARVRLGRLIDSSAKTSWKVLAQIN